MLGSLMIELEGVIHQKDMGSPVEEEEVGVLEGIGAGSGDSCLIVMGKVCQKESGNVL